MCSLSQSVYQIRLYRSAKQWFVVVCTLAALLLLPAPSVQAQVYFPGCMVAGSYDASVPHAWYQLSAQLIRETPGFSPPVAARAFGYMGVTLYEAVVPGMPSYRSFVGLLNGLTSLPPFPTGTMAHWPTAANAALAEIVRSLFVTATPENLEAIDALEAKFNQQFQQQLRSDVFTTSAEYGKSVAQTIFAWSLSDGGHEAYLRNNPESYTPPAGEGLWEPTPPKFARALQPTWGDNRPLALPSASSCLPPPPPEFSTDPASTTYQEALTVYNAVRNLTPKQLEIVLYWADNPVETATPPGHSLAISSQVLEQEGASLAKAAIIYAKAGIAVNDAFISSWHTKYTYNRLRPITYIQRYIDPGWNNPEITDPVTTPPFPAYTSGHSVEAGACMTVLSDLLGANTRFTDAIYSERGFAPRTFDTFMQAANEAAVSRLYGGIHFPSDNEAGLTEGVCVGGYVNNLKLTK
jgi:membrane-associated phospholipid phosphatase